MRIRSILVVVFAGWLLSVGGGMFSSDASAQTASRAELANMRADIEVLDRRMKEMVMAMEELRRENRRLAAQLDRQRSANSQLQDVVRQSQLDRAIRDLQQKTREADSEQRRQIIKEVSEQIDQLGRKTQAAIDAVAKNISSRPRAPSQSTPSFSEDFPKEGVSYTVQAGDTLSGIASRFNSTVRDIQNANRIGNAASIQIGQTLFIPQKED